MRKAQMAVELTVIASAIMLVLFILFEFGQTKINENVAITQVSEARNTVDRLAKAAIEVNTEGVGARRKIYVTIPDRVNPNRILIGNGTITIGVYIGDGTTDVSSPVGFTIAQGGYFPTTPGSYWVWVISRQGYVQIGSAVEISPSNVYFELFPTSSSNKNITLTNYGLSAINVTSSLTWGDSEVDVSVNSSSFTLSPGLANSQNININATANSNASRGLHSGYVSITTNISENEMIPILVYVVGQPAALQNVSYLTINTYNDSGYTNSSTNFFAPLSGTVVYYQVMSYSSTDELVDSTVTVKVYDPSSNLMNETTYSSNGGTGIYNGNYTLYGYYSSSGSWRITAYEIGGVSTATYITVVASCGDGTCSSEYGEDCNTCYTDCPADPCGQVLP
ncbi:MAG: hypothetical protein NT130_03625 [Candidatus Micrarchaeota archaeon]|nr:hypothetical protein [Candidatus Micrarchaeota archaeon]